MKEIRLHGRGGLGTVKAAEILVYARVMEGGYGNSIPFFGFERQGAPVTSFVRLDKRPIRPKNQVYNPDCIMVLEPTLMKAVDVYEGVRYNSVFVLNTTVQPGDIEVPANVKLLATVDATGIAMELLGSKITNTVMLGAFVSATGWVGLDQVKKRVEDLFGPANVEAVEKGYNMTDIYDVKAGDKIEIQK